MGKVQSALIGWVVAVAAAIAFISTVTAMVVSGGNRALQRDIAQRQQEVNQALQLSTLNNQLVQTLATLGVQRNDPQLTRLLADHGITVQVTPSAAPAAPAVLPSPSMPGVSPSGTR